MEVKVNGGRYDIFLEGPISEKTALYEYNIKTATEVALDMEKVTFINSIGVKNWITWTLRVPDNAALTLSKCPFVIISQVNMVHGFLPTRARINSFFAPFICNSCSHEKIELLKRGENFEYADAANPAKVSLPEFKCPKCGEDMEPDFIEKKTFGFLTPTPA